MSEQARDLVGQRVRIDDVLGRDGWCIALHEQPTCVIIDDHGVTRYIGSDRVKPILNTSDVSIGDATHLRDERQALPRRLGDFISWLYEMPHRMADALALSPYTLADALVDLVEPSPVPEPLAPWEQELLSGEAPPSSGVVTWLRGEDS